MAKKKNLNEDGTLKVFSFHPETGVFVGEEVAFPSPLEPGQFLIPAGATDVEPPKAQNGKDRKWNGADWVFESALQPETPPTSEVTDEYKAAAARYTRNNLLLQSDWRMLSDVPPRHSGVTWTAYRQALRDVPQQGGFPNSINWPTAP